jgi:nitrogen PTS system EIIA component
MDISNFLAPADTLIDVRAADKAGLLQQLAAKAAASLELAAGEILAELLKRESLGSTGTGGGIAVPHARLDRIGKPFGILARLHRAIDFDAIDARPVDLIVLLLLPREPPKGQINALAQVARKLRDGKIQHELRRAKTAEELYRAILAKTE